MACGFSVAHTPKLLPLCLAWMIAGSVFLLSACNGGHAPVIEAKDWRISSTRVVEPQKTFYRVRLGDTLYAIAWAVGADFRYLAQLNRLSFPYRIYEGQRLRLLAPVAVHGEKQHYPNHFSPPRHWLRPAHGPIVRGFAPEQLGGNQGVDFAGSYGSPVLAAAPGCIVYAGSGLRGYGKLVIIKHNDSFLSAYAYNSRLFVHPGQCVHAGQKIAAMGRMTSGRVLLHFEIRYNGKPVDPRRYLR